MNVPTSLIIVLLVAAWLVVLVPSIARRRERVPQFEPAGAHFRVLRRASASLRRRPVRRAKGTMMSTTEADGLHSGPDPEENWTVDIAEPSTDAIGRDDSHDGTAPDEEPADAAQEWAAAQAARRNRQAPLVTVGATPIGGTDAGRPPVRAGSSPFVPAGSDDGDDTDDATVDLRAPEAVDTDPVDTDPVDTDPVDTDPVDTDPVEADPDQDHATVPDEVDEQEWAEHAAAAPLRAPEPESQDVELRPVPRRRGRGGFDPEAAEATRAYRYQQRRRVAVILLVASLVFTLGALLVANWLWLGAVVSVGLLVGYLAYLRRQVRIEAGIRQRRMERLQRARQIRPEYARTPRRTASGAPVMTPGRTVVDLDDDDPAFDELDDYQEPMTYRRAVGQ